MDLAKTKKELIAQEHDLEDMYEAEELVGGQRGLLKTKYIYKNKK